MRNPKQLTYSLSKLVLLTTILIPIATLIAIALVVTTINPNTKDFTNRCRKQKRENDTQIDFEKITKRGLVSQNQDFDDFYNGLHIHG